jgi:hypothetical protein
VSVKLIDRRSFVPGDPHGSRGALRTLAIATPLVLLGCGGAAPDESQPEPVDAGGTTAQPSLPDREEFVRAGLIPPGSTRAELAEGLGSPDSIDFEVVPNRHVPGAMDTLFTVHYPELVAGIHRPGPGGELLSSFEVSANRHLRYPIIGAPGATVEAAFGPPDERTDSTLTYRCTTCIAGDDPVLLFLQNRDVDRVRFSYYVD